MFEIQTALEQHKPVMLMHETDSRHGAFDFAEAACAPLEIKTMIETHESLPWRRRRFEQDAILKQLVQNSGLEAAPAAGPPPPAQDGGAGTNQGPLEHPAVVAGGGKDSEVD